MPLTVQGAAIIALLTLSGAHSEKVVNRPQQDEALPAVTLPRHFQDITFGMFGAMGNAAEELAEYRSVVGNPVANYLAYQLTGFLPESTPKFQKAKQAKKAPQTTAKPVVKKKKK